MTDGSSSLHFIDPITLEKTGTIKVFDNGRPVMYLNEVEYVKGFIYANIFTTDWIVKIDIETGRVVGRIDVTDLKLEEDKKSNTALETNGIAYNGKTNQFYLTGKMWNTIYVISIFE
jgi:glutamine cyclotransferase